MGEEKKLTKADKAFYIGKRFVDEKDYICIEDSFYKYDEGIWNTVSHQIMSSEISNAYLFKYEPINTHQIKEIMRVIRDETVNFYKEDILKVFHPKAKNEVNLKDGILSLSTMTMRLYQKNDFAFFKLPFSYDPNKEIMCPSFKNFLITTFGFDEEGKDPEEFKELVYFLQEWFGYSLVLGNKLHLALIMVGDGRNGKGTLINTWTKIVGKWNSSFVDISGINDRQEICMTKNKLINFSTDLMDGQQLDTGTMKSAIAGEIVTGKEVYKKPETFQFTSKIIIATNELPYLKNVSHAVSERIHVLPFNRVFTSKNKDVNIGDKIEKELEGIFAWAIRGLVRLRARGKFVIPKICNDSLNDYLYEQDPIKLWLDEENVRSLDCKSEKKQVYYHYRGHCRESNKKPLGKIKFYKRLKKMGFDEIRSSEKRYFLGIKLPYDENM